MEEVELHDDTYERRKEPSLARRPGITDWLVSRGYVASRQRATTVLLAVTVLAALVTIGIWSLNTHAVRETPGVRPLLERMPHGTP